MNIDLTPFCHPGNSGYVLCEPFVKDGYQCACNGRICIRVKTDLPETNKPNVPAVGDVFDACDQTLPASIDITLPDVSKSVCGHCLGSGFSAGFCEMCDGDGGHRCECGDDHECASCDGTGRIKSYGGNACDACNGTGKGYENCEIAGLTFAGRYIAMICKNLTNPKAIATKIDDGRGTLRFVFDGGEGVLMELKC